jgi:hypothetical protein
MIVYRGTPIKCPFIERGSYVSEWLSRAANFARYPPNGPGNEIGYIYELEVEKSDVDWDEKREDCPQGKLKKDVNAKRMAICGIPLPADGGGLIRKYGPSLPWVWANREEIEWKPANL